MSTVTPERWEEIKDILDQALGLPVGERPGFVARACEGDPEARDEVESLLAEEEASTDFMEQPLVSLRPRLEDLAAPSPVPLTGTLLGPWRVQSTLGRGGMGVVYLGERADGLYDQQVAIKVLKRGMDTDLVLERFREERRILAQLEHPNIARLLDAGSTPDGRPYLVIERVEGVPIDRWCDERRLGVAERLRLFLRLCDGVELAHRNLVVHRDIKPTNVLVTADGTPKLLDFGIAKLLGPDDQAAPATMVALRPMTLEYASPEQIQGRPVTTAADVYSLGVLLFELLTGRRPHRPQTKVPAEIARTIVSEEPRRASVAASDPADDDVEADGRDPAAIAHDRGTTPRDLRRRLRGDLDTLLATALAREPERRYASVERLADDVRRHLEGRPLTARGEAWTYRASKFVRRHAAWVATAALVFVAAIVVALVMTSLRTDAVEAQEAAEKNAEVAQEVTDYLVEVFLTADPEIDSSERIDPDTTSVTQLLADSRESLLASPDFLQSGAALQANLLNVLGKVHWRLGLYDEALPLYDRCIDLGPQLSGEDRAFLAQCLAQKGLVLERKEGVSPTSLGFLEDALEIHRDQTNPTPNDLAEHAEVLSRYAFQLRRFGDIDRAIQANEEALELKRERWGENSRELAANYQSLAIIYRFDRPIEAFDTFADALQARLEAPVEELGLPASLSNLGVMHTLFGDPAEAEALFSRSVETTRSIFGEDHERQLQDLANLAHTLRLQGRHAAAESTAREALALAERNTVSSTKPDVLNARRHLAIALADQGRFAEARAVLEPLLADLAPTEGSGRDWALQELRLVRAGILAREGRGAEAEALALAARDRIDELFTRDDVVYQREAHRRLAELYETLDRPAEARRWRQAIAPRLDFPPAAPFLDAVDTALAAEPDAD